MSDETLTFICKGARQSGGGPGLAALTPIVICPKCLSLNKLRVAFKCRSRTQPVAV